MTTSTSRPPRAASHASRCPGRKAWKPKYSWRAAARSTRPHYRRGRRAPERRRGLFTLVAKALREARRTQYVSGRRSLSERRSRHRSAGDNRLWEFLQGELAVGVLAPLQRVVDGEAGVAVGLAGGADG